MTLISIITMYFSFGYDMKICDGINGIYFDGFTSISDAGYTKKAYKKLTGNDAIKCY